MLYWINPNNGTYYQADSAIGPDDFQVPERMSSDYSWDFENERWIGIESPVWVNLKNKRNLLLNETDWTQGNDSPLSEAKKELWAQYRTELRNLPNNYCETRFVIWPVKPE